MIESTPNHHRRSIRLKGYDYSQAGAYYVSICSQDKRCLFGEIVDREVRLNDCGRMIAAQWDGIPDRFPAVELDAFIVTPNHFHGILSITQGTACEGRPYGGAAY